MAPAETGPAAADADATVASMCRSRWSRRSQHRGRAARLPAEPAFIEIWRPGRPERRDHNGQARRPRRDHQREPARAPAAARPDGPAAKRRPASASRRRATITAARTSGTSGQTSPGSAHDGSPPRRERPQRTRRRSGLRSRSIHFHRSPPSPRSRPSSKRTSATADAARMTADDRRRIDKWLWFARVTKTRTARAETRHGRQGPHQSRPDRQREPGRPGRRRADDRARGGHSRPQGRRTRRTPRAGTRSETPLRGSVAAAPATRIDRARPRRRRGRPSATDGPSTTFRNRQSEDDLPEGDD